ncbi:MAG: Na-translocating system protein MpsC family protein [Cyanobacteria bacterium J06623_5]
MTKFVSSDLGVIASENHQSPEKSSQKHSKDDSKEGKLDAASGEVVAVLPSENGLPTVGQLMRTVSQKLFGLYREQLSHVPDNVSCHLFSNKLVVWVDGSVTDVEKRLAEMGSERLELVREAFDEIFSPKIIALVERCLQVDVVTLMSDTCYEQRCTSLMLLLAEHPRVRPSRKSAGSA